MVDYDSTLEGNTWHASLLRDVFHQKLRELNDRISDLESEGTFSPHVEVLAAKSASELRSLSTPEGEEGNAYRYALRELNPFALLGFVTDNITSTARSICMTRVLDPALQ